MSTGVQLRAAGEGGRGPSPAHGSLQTAGGDPGLPGRASHLKAETRLPLRASSLVERHKLYCLCGKSEPRDTKTSRADGG